MEILQTNFFFIVTTAVVLVLGAIIALALWYVVRILRRIERISRLVEEQARTSRVFSSLFGLWRGRRSRRPKSEDDEPAR